MLLLLMAACTGQGDAEVPTRPSPTGAPARDTGGVGPTGETDTGSRIAPPLELCINEFMPWNVRYWDDGNKSWPDWIEIHNPVSSKIDMAGWSLTDDRDQPDKHQVTTSLVVEPGGFLILVADGRPELGPTHLSFALDRQGGEVALFRSDGSAEILSYGAVAEDLAVARATDCGPLSDWAHTFEGTPGASNQ